MPNLGTLRASVATALDTVTGLRVPADGLWPEAVNLPAGLVRAADDAAPMVLDGSVWEEALEVTVLVSLAGGLTRSQQALDGYYDGVRTALVAQLGHKIVALRRQAYGVLEIDGIEYLGIVLRLEMIDE